MTRRRGMMRAVLGGMAAFALALGGVTTAAADDPETTTITGTVTSAVDGAPVASVSVFVNNEDFTQNGSSVVENDGTYRVEGLPAGEYTVRFAATGTDFIGEYWDGVRNRNNAQWITAVGGETISGIDATLDLGGGIAGTVTRESDGSPIAGMLVFAQTGSFLSGRHLVATDPEGRYRFEGLTPGSYTVSFPSPDGVLIDEYWEGTQDKQSATLVPVTAGQVATGIDASLTDVSDAERIGFEGVVTKAEDGSPVVGFVNAFAAGAQSYTTPIQPDGSYELLVPPGVYRVQFASSDPRILSEYLEDAYTLEDASPVVVATNGGMFEFNPQLETGRAITGVVLADGEPLEDAIVETFVDGQLSGSMAYTDQDGEYEIILPPGDYTLRAYGSSYDPVYAWQYFDGADTASQATEVSLGSSSDRTGVDFDLSRGGAIRGSVSADGAEPSPAEVTAYLWSDGEWRTAAVVFTEDGFDLGTLGFQNAEGGQLPAGRYTVGVKADGFCPQFLGGAQTLDDAEPIELVGGQVLTDVDFTLTTDCDTTPPQPKPALSLSADSLRAGGDITVSGTGFAPGEKISFELRSDPIALGALTADAQGTLQGSFRIPVGAPVGAHTLVALNAQSVVVASAALQVTAATGSAVSPGSGSAAGDRLANTGSEVPFPAMFAAFALVALGSLLTRRRRIES